MKEKNNEGYQINASFNPNGGSLTQGRLDHQVQAQIILNLPVPPPNIDAALAGLVAKADCPPPPPKIEAGEAAPPPPNIPPADVAPGLVKSVADGGTVSLL